jgi:glycogen synthase
LRILTLSNLYPPDVAGGYELACSQAVDALRERGHEVLVLTANPRFPLVERDPEHVLRRFQLVEDRDWIEDDEPDAFRAVRDAGSRFVNAQNVHALIEAIDRFGPNVVYVHNLIGLGGLGLIATLQHLGVPWVWHLGDAVPRELCCDRHAPIRAIVTMFNQSVRGQFIAVSQQLVDEIHAAGIVLADEVHVIPRFATPPTPAPEAGIAVADKVHVIPYWFIGDRPSARRPRKIDAPFRIMSCGLVNRQKGIDVLIQAAALLRQAGQDRFVVDIYGRVADPSLATMIREHDLTGHVRLLGPHPHAEILRLYGEYDLFAFPTREREPFGIVPFEALARGCVPLMSRRCGAAEWLTHGVHCLKAARTAEGFADTIRSILSGCSSGRRESRAHLGARAARRIAWPAWPNAWSGRTIAREAQSGLTDWRHSDKPAAVIAHPDLMDEPRSAHGGGR